MNGYTYVQGAADDHELWSQGLDPQLFWENVDQFTSTTTTEKQVDERIDALVEERKRKHEDQHSICDDVSVVTPQLSVGKLTGTVNLGAKWSPPLSGYDLVVVFDKSSHSDSPQCIVVPASSGSKKASKELRNILPALIPQIGQKILNDEKILLLCSSGSDVSAGVLLALITLYYDQDWNLLQAPLTRRFIEKTSIRRQLTQILEKRRVNPSRATLKAINYYLMSES